MTLDFAIKETDTHQWLPAVGTDVGDIVELSSQHFADESAGMLVVDLHRAAKLVTEAVVNQLYYNTEEFMIVARNKTTKKLEGWAWAKRKCYMEYSSEETTELRMIHIDKSLVTRQKIALVGQAISIWYQWAEMNRIPVLVSATLRNEQSAFLRILDALGFTVNGSYAFIRTDRQPEQNPQEALKVYLGAQRK